MNLSRILGALLLAASVLTGGGAAACEGGGEGPVCAKIVSPAFTPDGTLLLAWPVGERMMVARSKDGGRSFEGKPAAIVSKHGIFDMAEGRPAVAADSKGRVHVGFTVKQPDSKYAGTLMLASSEDGGRSFSPPRAIATDPTSQGFVAMVVEKDDRLTLAWIDKRAAAAAKKDGKPYRAAGLMLAWSDDGGHSFSHQEMAVDHACECCRIAMTLDQRGLPLIMWRQVFEPNIRDHALLSFVEKGRLAPLARVGEDNWKVDACPHHGPSLGASDTGAVHAVWFTKGAVGPGLYYASRRQGEGFSRQIAIGDPAYVPSHPQVAARGEAVWLAWKEFDGAVTRIMVQTSSDGGATWTLPRSLAETAHASDHPILVGDGGSVFLSWQTRQEGFRLIRLVPPS
jgi:hypothetical protein